MFFVDILSWWYGPGLQWAYHDGLRWLRNWDQMFDVKIIAATLFEPWRQIKTRLPRDASLDMHLKAWADNMVSRCVGMMIRLSTLIAALISLVLIGSLMAARLVLWLPMPFLPIIMVAWYVL